MAVTINAKGTSVSEFAIGKQGPKLKNSSGAIEARNSADSAYAVVRASDAVGDNDAVIKSQFTQGVRTAGVVVLPTYQDNGDGSVTIGAGEYSLYDNANFAGAPKTYVISGGTFTLTNNSANYIMAAYNGGSPELQVITAVPPASTTDSDKVPIFSTYRSGTDIHFFNWDHLANGLAEKINQRLRRTDRFHIDNGLGLSETPTRVIDIESGEVWAGANLISLDAIDSSSPEVHFYYHVAGVWTRGTISQYNNSQYDNGTNLVTLNNNKYAVNWIYRSVEQVGAIYVLLGTGDYTLLEAQASVEPSKPVEISTQSVLIGRIIVQKSASTATQIDRVVDVTFGASPVANHNDSTGIQGGAAGEYYHLTYAQYQDLTSSSAVIPQTFVAGVDFVAGSSTTLTLSSATDPGVGILIFFDGVGQNPDTYSISGTTLTFTSAIPTGVSAVYTVRGIGGSLITFPTTTKTANYTATSSDFTIRCDASSGQLTVTLPAASANVGKVYNIKKIDASSNSVVIDGDGSETIDGALTAAINIQYLSLSVQANGTSWDII